jgi:hypothetical protein
VGPGGAAGPAQQRAHPGHQLPRAVRLGQVVVGAEVEAEQQVVLGGPGGQHQHRHVGLAAQDPAHVEAVEPGIITSSTSRSGGLRRACVERGPAVVHHDAARALVLQVAPEHLGLLRRPRRPVHVRTWHYRLLKVHSLATHAWAPEAYWDAARGQYAVVYSAVVGGHNVLMVNYTTDFVTASAPQVFFDPGYDAIDGNFVTAGGVNYMYFKNNTNSTLLGTRSSSLNPGSFSIYTGAIGPAGASRRRRS